MGGAGGGGSGSGGGACHINGRGRCLEHREDEKEQAAEHQEGRRSKADPASLHEHSSGRARQPAPNPFHLSRG
jgi:hypothetical protein